MSLPRDHLPRFNMSIAIELFILGVEKAGTTALFRHLAQSPLVHAHAQREMFYFLADDEFARGWAYGCHKYFPGYEQGLVVAKNVMQITSREAMTRLKEQCPEVKCVIMLREPAARAYSAYNYAVLRGAEECRTFEEALAREDERGRKNPKSSNPLLYIENSTYAPKVKAAFDIYGRDRVLVIHHEEYKIDLRAQLARVETFMGRNLFAGVGLDFSPHNRAARARFPWLARWVYRLLQAQNPIKRSLRAILPHDKAATLRHAVLNFNRIETPYRPMAEKTAGEIRRQLTADRQQLVALIGDCPWGEQ